MVQNQKSRRQEPKSDGQMVVAAVGRQNQPIAGGAVVGRAKLVGQRDESEGRPAEGDN